MHHISPSQLEAFNCRLQWYWNKQGYVPMRINQHLELGLGVHLALEKFYAERRHPVKVFTRWVDKRIAEIGTQWEDDVALMVQARTLGIVMLEGYLERYWRKEPLKIIATEHECERPLLSPKGNPTGCNVFVRVDAIVEDIKLKQLFVLEHKTFTSFTPGQLSRDHQFVAEVWVANQLAWELTGRHLDGLIYNGLRKQVPSPRVKNELFERHYIYINAHQQQVFLKRAYWTWKQMSNPKLPIFPEPNLIRCNQCYYREACAEYMSGGDYQFILDQMFTQRRAK